MSGCWYWGCANMEFTHIRITITDTNKKTLLHFSVYIFTLLQLIFVSLSPNIILYWFTAQTNRFGQYSWSNYWCAPSDTEHSCKECPLILWVLSACCQLHAANQSMCTSYNVTLCGRNVCIAHHVVNHLQLLFCICSCITQLKTSTMHEYSVSSMATARTETTREPT